MTTVTLQQGQKGEPKWRVEVATTNARTATLGTAIELSTPTELVVKTLLKMFPGAQIKGPQNQSLYPKQPGGYPQIHSSQPSRQ